ncbi:MAG: UDP-N-acetylglucosamine 1-carboxyvinyltransferase, UDP-N-acetylglucosamine 1-carboxyvinyltransferase, partial [Parcubacteria group bacterium GW2011_GWC1_43_11b]
MSKFVINGGRKLEGKITLSGNKNSALKLIPAALLADTPSTLTNVPDLTDIEVMLELIRDLGAKATYKDHTVTIDPQGLSSFNINPELSSKIR